MRGVQTLVRGRQNPAMATGARSTATTTMATTLATTTTATITDTSSTQFTRDLPSKRDSLSSSNLSLLIGTAEPGYGYRSQVYDYNNYGYNLGHNNYGYNYGYQHHSIHKRSPFPKFPLPKFGFPIKFLPI